MFEQKEKRENMTPPMVAGQEISLDELQTAVWRFEKSSIRVEVFDNYSAPSDDQMFAAFLAGQSMPTPSPGWRAHYDRIRHEITQGKEISRIHIVPESLSPYLRYEIEWAYSSYNAPSGEKIFIVNKDAHPEIARLHQQDFYLLDHSTSISLEFDENMKFVKGVLNTDQAVVRFYQDFVSRAMCHALTLQEYLSKMRTAKLIVPS